MICPNCGGEFADWALKCPYCGGVNDKGAEAEYMKHMEELRKRLDNLDEESEASYSKSMSRTVKRLLIVIGILLAAAVVIILAFFIVRKNELQKSEDFYLAEKAWQKEEYKKLDAMYDEGDYAGIIDEYYAMLDEPYSISSWTHYCYITEFYYNYSNLLTAKAQFDDDNGDYYTLGMGIYSALYLYKYTTDDYLSQLEDNYKANGTYGLSADEVEIIRGYQTDSKDFLESTLGLSADELDNLYTECAPDGYLSIESCLVKANELAEDYGWVTE